MKKNQVLLFAFALLTLPCLLGLMAVIHATVGEMYDSWGTLQYKPVIVPAVTITPLPLFIAMIGVAIYAKTKISRESSAF